MLKYAVVRIKGHQYKVAEGQEILVDRLGSGKVDHEVLLVVNDEKVLVGKPLVSGVRVKIKILENEVKGEKIHVRKYKAKSRYRRHIGFRPQYTRLLVEKIS